MHFIRKTAGDKDEDEKEGVKREKDGGGAFEVPTGGPFLAPGKRMEGCIPSLFTLFENKQTNRNAQRKKGKLKVMDWLSRLPGLKMHAFLR